MGSLKEHGIVVPSNKLVKCCELDRSKLSNVPRSHLFFLPLILADVLDMIEWIFIQYSMLFRAVDLQAEEWVFCRS